MQVLEPASIPIVMSTFRLRLIQASTGDGNRPAACSMGFWFKAGAAPRFNPQKYGCGLRKKSAMPARGLGQKAILRWR
jgi:hypothetical protein